MSVALFASFVPSPVCRRHPSSVHIYTYIAWEGARRRRVTLALSVAVVIGRTGESARRVVSPGVRSTKRGQNSHLPVA